MLKDIRELDNLGRIVIPIEIRRELGLKAKEKLHISFSDNEITVRKQCNVCVFCNKANISEKFCGKYICAACIKELRAE